MWSTCFGRDGYMTEAVRRVRDQKRLGFLIKVIQARLISAALSHAPELSSYTSGTDGSGLFLFDETEHLTQCGVRYCERCVAVRHASVDRGVEEHLG